MERLAPLRSIILLDLDGFYAVRHEHALSAAALMPCPTCMRGRMQQQAGPFCQHSSLAGPACACSKLRARGWASLPACLWPCSSGTASSRSTMPPSTEESLGTCA